MRPHRWFLRPSDQIGLHRTADGPWVIVTASGELDVAVAPQLRTALDPDTFPGRRTHLAVDLSGVSFCDSFCVGVLMGAYKKLRHRDGLLILLHTPKSLARQLKISGLDHILPMQETLDPNQSLN